MYFDMWGNSIYCKKKIILQKYARELLQVNAMIHCLIYCKSPKHIGHIFRFIFTPFVCFRVYCNVINENIVKCQILYLGCIVHK